MDLKSFLKQMVNTKASDVFIIAGLPISYRANGRQSRMNGAALTPADTKALVKERTFPFP